MTTGSSHTTDPSAPSGRRSLAELARRAAERAQQSARILREEFDKGARGDALDEPTPVLWDRPTFEHLKALVRAGRPAAPVTGRPADSEPASDDYPPAPAGPMSPEAAAAEVSGVLERIDWHDVTTTADERGADVAERLRSLAAEVDWERMKPVAGKVATALIAAAATGHLGRLSGPTAQAVARAINGDHGVGEAAASIISRRPGGAAAAQVMKNFLGDGPAAWAPPAEQAAVSTAVSSVHVGEVEVIPAGGFEARLAELRALADPL